MVSYPENPTCGLGSTLKGMRFLPDNHHDFLQDIFSQLFLSQQVKKIAEQRALETCVHLGQRFAVSFCHPRQQEVFGRFSAHFSPDGLTCMPGKSNTNQLIWPPYKVSTPKARNGSNR